MGKGIILYKSRYGATAKYANWLAEATGFACKTLKEATVQDWKDCDTVVLGGGIYASGIAGLSFLKKNRQSLAGKKLAVFCVGASPFDQKTFDELCAHNFGGELQGTPCFYCRGAWNESAMNPFDRTLCRLLQKSLEKADPATFAPWQQALMEARGKSCDWTDKKYLTPLLEYLNK